MNKSVKIRNPHATRPWQHVLEPISGYLLAGYYLLSNKKKITGLSFNFGPSKSDNKSVKDILFLLKEQWKGLKIIFKKEKSFVEHTLLQLSSQKAKKILKWESVLNFNETIKMTSEWYRALIEKKKHDRFYKSSN